MLAVGRGKRTKRWLPASSCAPRREFPTIALSNSLLTCVHGESKKKPSLLYAWAAIQHFYGLQVKRGGGTFPRPLATWTSPMRERSPGWVGRPTELFLGLGYSRLFLI
jgi:hypothetical protein